MNKCGSCEFFLPDDVNPPGGLGGCDLETERPGDSMVFLDQGTKHHMRVKVLGKTTYLEIHRSLLLVYPFQKACDEWKEREEQNE